MAAQIPEVLILDGTTHPMTFCPPLPPDRSKLNFNIRHENFVTADMNGEVHHKTIARWTDANGIERTTLEEAIVLSPACSRRYRGTWRIRDDRLYLVELTGRYRLREPGPLLADWFSGVLRVPLGSEILFVDMGFASVYEKELHIAVRSGRICGRQTLDYLRGGRRLYSRLPEAHPQGHLDLS